jgi:glycine dehydrogenase subunit 1
MDYVQITRDDREQMLAAVGASSIEDLLKQVPSNIRLKRSLAIPAALDELSLRRHLTDLAGQNHPVDQKVCFLGAGAYDHFIPAVVDFLAMKGEFLTAYTPYQAEASQGSLQAFFEFQTMVCQISGMDVANASLYEGATALAEAALLALHSTGKRQLLVSAGVHPHYRRVLRTYISDLPVTYREIALADGVTDPAALEGSITRDTAAVIVQSPNFLGHIEDVPGAARTAHSVDALCVQAYNPLSVGLLKRPGDLDVDVAVADGQPLGIPLQFGGPYLGLFSARNTFMRKMPGRLVGQTVDLEGRRAFCLTLQTREQHIRREKATSNVCTNQGLLALRASVYMATMGPQGLRQAATLCHDKAAYLADRLAAAGVHRRFPHRPFFNEILVRLPKPLAGIVQRASSAGILPGYEIGREYPELSDCLLIAVTEKRTRGEIDRLVEVLSS